MREPETKQLKKYSVDRWTHGLSRMITQPRGVYDALQDEEPGTWPVPGFESALIDHFYRARQTSSRKDLREDNEIKVLSGLCDDPKESQEDWSTTGHFEEDREDSSHSTAPKAAKRSHLKDFCSETILGRKLGANQQRNRAFVRIADLEYSLQHFQNMVATLSSQVSILSRHAWILRSEKFTLKRKIAEMSKYDFLKQGENQALENEVRLLKLQQSPSGAALADANQGLNAVHDGKSSFTDIHTGVLPQQTKDHMEISTAGPHRVEDSYRLSETLSDEKEIKEISHPPNTSEESDNDVSRSASSPQNTQKRLLVVRWPSTLYRSVSAITRESGVVKPLQEDETLRTEAQGVGLELPQDQPAARAGAVTSSLDQGLSFKHHDRSTGVNNGFSCGSFCRALSEKDEGMQVPKQAGQTEVISYSDEVSTEKIGSISSSVASDPKLIRAQMVRWPSSLYRSVSAITRESAVHQPSLHEEHPDTTGIQDKKSELQRPEEHSETVADSVRDETNAGHHRNYRIFDVFLPGSSSEQVGGAETSGEEAEEEESSVLNEAPRDELDTRSSSSQQNDGKSKGIVRWPSTLYRSVSAITRESRQCETSFEKQYSAANLQCLEPDHQEQEQHVTEPDSLDRAIVSREENTSGLVIGERDFSNQFEITQERRRGNDNKEISYSQETSAVVHMGTNSITSDAEKDQQTSMELAKWPSNFYLSVYTVTRNMFETSLEGETFAKGSQLSKSEQLQRAAASVSRDQVANCGHGGSTHFDAINGGAWPSTSLYRSVSA